MIKLEPHDEGVILPVKAQPGSRSDGIRGEHAGALKVCITQVAEKGKANEAIIEVLAMSLGLRRSQIELLSGATSPQKRFLIRGVTHDQLRALLPK